VPSKDINHTPSTSIHKINTKKKGRKGEIPTHFLSFFLVSLPYCKHERSNITKDYGKVILRGERKKNGKGKK